MDSRDQSLSTPRRRDVLAVAGNLCTVGTALGLAEAFVAASPPSLDVDIAKIAPGSGIKVAWSGQPVFIRHLAAPEIAAVQAVPLADLRDPQSLETRTQAGYREWLVVIAVCPHLGCVPLGVASGEPRGRYGGFLCPCHGSQFDAAGRVREGPAPTNLEVPSYRFHGGTMIRFGRPRRVRSIGEGRIAEDIALTPR